MCPTTGAGATLGTDLFGRGVGLSATRDRLRLLYGSAHRFDAGNRDGGFAVRIELPFRRAHAVPGTADADSAAEADVVASVASGESSRAAV
jgi:hypothetical protein